jgi:thiol-disulfide isomerase/thioredoxin
LSIFERRSSRLLALAAIVLMATAGGAYVGLQTRTTGNAETLPSASAVGHLFATRLADSNGKLHDLAQWRGKTLVVNFWATWCPPCREEMPYFSRLSSKYAANGVQFVGIALDTAENVSSYAKTSTIAYPLLVADAGGAELTRQLGNSNLALPYTVVVGADGESRLTRLGRVSEQELDRLLQTLTAN